MRRINSGGRGNLLLLVEVPGASFGERDPSAVDVSLAMKPSALATSSTPQE